ncbi:MAG: transposase family protein, partial [Acidobacteria bacterium]|nr:transposase family protein [Acidobacteriota bacterium]
LTGSECEMILKLAGDAIGDKGFIGTDYIITPVRKPKDRDLRMSEHDYNNQISSLRAPVERAVANLKTWRILFTDYRRPLKPSCPRSEQLSAYTSLRRVLHNPQCPPAPGRERRACTVRPVNTGSDIRGQL